MFNVLITGGAGFIGSNFISYILDANQNYRVINLDNLSYAGNLNNLESVVDHPQYHMIKGNINNRELLEYIFTNFNINSVVHFAAESHVDNSILTPDVFIDTNVHGTFTLLDVAYKHWMSKPFHYKKGYENSRFHHISTDEVYGSLGDTGLFTEQAPYAPNSPYSASKASSDMIVRSYHHTYGLNTVITNCSNNYGPKQHDEKLIPTIIRNAIKGHPIPIYGDGKNIRDWLYVSDHCKGIYLVLCNGVSGGTYNIGGGNEKTNLEIAYTICEALDFKLKKQDSYKNLISFVSDRPGHDKRYAIDATKISSELGWSADVSFDAGIQKTVDWYINKYEAL